MSPCSFGRGHLTILVATNARRTIRNELCLEINWVAICQEIREKYNTQSRRRNRRLGDVSASGQLRVYGRTFAGVMAAAEQKSVRQV